jgi:hypothetical protein
MNTIAMGTEILWLMSDFLLDVQDLALGIKAILLGHLCYMGNCNHI